MKYAARNFHVFRLGILEYMSRVFFEELGAVCTTGQRPSRARLNLVVKRMVSRHGLVDVPMKFDSRARRAAQAVGERAIVQQSADRTGQGCSVTV